MVRISKIPVYDDDFDHLADQAFTSPEKEKKKLYDNNMMQLSSQPRGFSKKSDFGFY